MRLDLLLERESFPDTFINTLTLYLKQCYGWNGRVEWSQKNDVPTEKFVSKFLVNEKLNLIFPSDTTAATLRALGAEYIYHPNLIRRWLQYLYVTFSVTNLFRRLTSRALIRIEPLPDCAKQWCILPGNHTIRILDYRRNHSIVLLKCGFNQDYFSNEIYVRKRFSDLPGPKLLDANHEEGWYIEEIISGLPLNRLADKHTVESTMNAARSAMVSLYDRTSVSLLINNWLMSRHEQLLNTVKILPTVYGGSVKNSLLHLADWLTAYIKNSINDAQLLPLVTTHGDFQDANILLPKDKLDVAVYLIDWEYSAQRCIWYDALVYSLKSRFPSGLSERVLEWIADDYAQQDTLDWCCSDLVKKWDARVIIACFLIEDLIVWIGDTTIPSLKVPQSGFLTFIGEVGKLEKHLSKVQPR